MFKKTRVFKLAFKKVLPRKTSVKALIKFGAAYPRANDEQAHEQTVDLGPQFEFQARKIRGAAIAPITLKRLSGKLRRFNQFLNFNRARSIGDILGQNRLHLGNLGLDGGQSGQNAEQRIHLCPG